MHEYRLIHDKWSDSFGRNKLRVAKINNFINYLINKHEILADAFFIKNATIVTEYFHHSVYDVEHT